MIRQYQKWREKADYQDFFLVSHEMAEEQLEKAEKIIKMLEPYLEQKWKNLE